MSVIARFLRIEYQGREFLVALPIEQKVIDFVDIYDMPKETKIVYAVYALVNRVSETIGEYRFVGIRLTK